MKIDAIPTVMQLVHISLKEQVLLQEMDRISQKPTCFCIAHLADMHEATAG
jgi:hypothetical protein